MKQSAIYALLATVGLGGLVAIGVWLQVYSPLAAFIIFVMVWLLGYVVVRCTHRHYSE